MLHFEVKNSIASVHLMNKLVLDMVTFDMIG